MLFVISLQNRNDDPSLSCFHHQIIFPISLVKPLHTVSIKVIAFNNLVHKGLEITNK